MTNRLEELEAQFGCNWPTIRKAKQAACETRELLKMLFGKAANVDSEDVSIVAFGSLARDEWTNKSDLDWTLLVDGQADPEHLAVAQHIASQLGEKKFPKPGRTGIFGNIAFSHDLIHQIGGEHDTNRNITHRVLLVLESVVIGNRPDAHDRVVTGILDRYLRQDPNVLTDQGRYKVPRFLLNDIVRFWRTMAVDFASKQREREGEGWGLRNLKLRMSRKLIFVSGLLSCFNCNLRLTALHSPSVQEIASYLKQQRAFTPLELLADALLHFHTAEGTCRDLFDAYEDFLSILDDEGKRTSLEQLRPEEAMDSVAFKEVREISHRFQNGLTQLFLDEKSPVVSLTKKYGVF